MTGREPARPPRDAGYLDRLRPEVFERRDGADAEWFGEVNGRAGSYARSPS
jgi:hypothetical protein